MKGIDKYYKIIAITSFFSIILVLLSIVTTSVHAASVPYTFEAGDTARASEVNANFDYLEQRVWDPGLTDPNDLCYNSGYVGIRTTRPDTELEVVGTITATAFVGNGSGLTGIADGHSLDAADGNPTDVVYVDNDGKVGIGTTNPEQKLSVNGVIESTSGGIKFPDGTTQTTATSASGDNLGNHIATQNIQMNGKNLTYDLSSDLYRGLTITENNNVRMYGSITAQNHNLFDVWVANGPLLMSLNCDSDYGSYINICDSGTVRVKLDSDGSSYFTGDRARVGIGTASPSYKLHVEGTAYATGAAGSLSDIRHKKNINDLSFEAIDIVNDLRPVAFEWKEPRDSGMEGEQFGFIAQEVEEILPEAIIMQNNDEKTMGLKYNALIPVLTKAIQELATENNALKAKIEALNATNNYLSQEIEQIKKVIGL